MRSSPMSTRSGARMSGGWPKPSSSPVGWRSRRSARSINSLRSSRPSRRRCALVQVHRVVVVGAAGRKTALGQDAGMVAGAGAIGIPITADLSEIFLVGRPTVLVDLSRGEGAAEHALVALDHRVPVVFGATE